MINKFLLASPDKKVAEKLGSLAKDTGLECSVVANGKDAQLSIYNEKFSACVIDVTLKNHTCFEVLRYIKCINPSLAVLLYFPNKEIFEELNLNKKEFRSLGVSNVFIGDSSLSRVIKSIEENCQPESWKKVLNNNENSELDDKEVAESDSKFTRLSINELHMGSTTIFDIYIRLKRDRYIKIFQKGDFFEASRIAKYKEQSVEYLYFKSEERSMYINYMNKVISKALKVKGLESAKKFDLLKTTTDKIFESISSEGIRPQLVDESMQLCKSLHSTVDSDPNLSTFLKNFAEFDPEAYEHTFLVSFFSVLICHNLSWGSERTSQIVGLASLLHDIGKLKLNPALKDLRPDQMTKSQLEEYKTHPRMGLEMMQHFPQIKEPVKQVIYQHHELVDGTGFPNSLTGIRIYPLAKIVNVADGYSHIIKEKKLSPIAALRAFMLDRQEIKSRDPEIMKALMKGFIVKK